MDQSEFVVRMKRGTVSTEDFTMLLRGIERKNIPLGARVKDRLNELKLQVEELVSVTKNEKRNMSMDEWRWLRKLARHGKRISTRFGEKDMAGYFGALSGTATSYLIESGEKI